MSGYIQSNQIVTLPYVNITIDVADSGKILMTPQTAGGVDVVYTLPTLEAGLHYRFINNAGLALNGSVQINAPAGTLYGQVITGPLGGVAFLAVSGSTQIRFLTAESTFSDFIDLYCDGLHWYVEAASSTAGAITVT